MSEKKGISTKSDFVDVVSNCYFVDKSHLIKELIDKSRESDALLFTRPRRFGKSLNLDMIKTFFEKTKKDTSKYFKDLEIWKCGREYTSKQGKYPVIYLDFKTVMQGTYEEALGLIADVLSSEFSRHGELKRSLRVNRGHDLKTYEKIVGKCASLSELTLSLEVLSRMLYAHHKVKPIILIDEYDVPIQTGADKGYYDKIMEFMRPFLSAGLKNNKSLYFAVLTGVTRSFKEGVFSGLNNAETYSVLNDGFVRYFGFTKEETLDFLKYFGAPEKMDEVCEWYDGYLFGTETYIFNPWSVSHYINSGYKAQAYWVNTSSNSIINEVLGIGSSAVRENLITLMKGGTISVSINDNVAYTNVTNEESVYSVLLAAGYLTPSPDNDGGRVLKIPNKEVADVFKSEILDHLWPAGSTSAGNMKKALVKGDIDEFNRLLTKFMRVSSNCYDTSGEKSYQNIMVGFTAAFDDIYMAHSNHTAGYGRSDIELIPRFPERNYPGVIFEFEKCDDESEMEERAKEGLKQIDDLHYDAQLLDAGVKVICKYGIAFCG
ncbi:MAG: ATP-binding protein, partial [Clostridia bacterium]|nr:ATP-binding protein [Clostridia bacterium]